MLAIWISIPFMILGVTIATLPVIHAMISERRRHAASVVDTVSDVAAREWPDEYRRAA